MDLYRKFLADDVETVEMLDKYTVTSSILPLSTVPEEEACWGVGHDTKKTDGLYFNHDFIVRVDLHQEGA
ncbi:MAG: hypothetical protein ABR985_07735 [Methanotrichaceae archaeon]